MTITRLWRALTLLTLSLLINPFTLVSASNQQTATQIIRSALDAICQQQKPNYPLTETQDINSRGQAIGTRATYSIDKDASLEVETLQHDGKVSSYRLTLLDKPDMPVVFIAADANCVIRSARKIIYQDGNAVKLQQLKPDLSTVIATDVINPEVPAGRDPGGLRVGIVDSGVNYLLADISQQLARGPDGEILGYDFWDMDKRPFDSNPARSVFFPQRHGTRTASLLLKEAPGISLLPYRYPRLNMSRMTRLVGHAARDKVRIIAMPLGSWKREEWLPFRQAAAQHPHILFVISSGNNGVDIDERPVYPAAFSLDNLLVVSAADDEPYPASRTNWGVKSVDLLVPADRQTALDFSGNKRQVSGTSYAVSRVTALVARLAQQHPDWNARQLKQAVLEIADSNHATRYTSHGLLNDPLRDTAFIKQSSEEIITSTQSQPADNVPLHIGVSLLNQSGWEKNKAIEAVGQATQILLQCGVALTVTLSEYDVSDYLLDFHSLSSRTLTDRIAQIRPTIFLVRNTRRAEAFGGEAFGAINATTRPWLSNTAWLIAEQKDPGIALTHELFHILTDSGEHSIEQGNLMNKDTEPTNTHLSEKQCQLLRQSRFFSKQ